MKYNIEHFIWKFGRIPERSWCTKKYVKDNAHCALGHCGVGALNDAPEVTVEALDLAGLFGGYVAVAKINDGKDQRYLQPTPKQRVLAALHDLKAKEDK